jgi:AraC-like DNA-binding protein
VEKRSNPRASTDIVRKEASFPLYPAITGISPDDLQIWLEALQVQPISAMEWQWTPGWGVGRRVINDSMWFWFERGRGWGWVGDRNHPFRLQGGDLVLIPQGVEHAFHTDADSSMHLVAVHFHAQVFGAINLLRLLGMPAHFSGEGIFKEISNNLAREFAVKTGGWMSSMRWQILMLLMHIIRAHGDRCKLVYSGVSNLNLPRLLPAFGLIETELDKRDLGVDEIAQTVFLSEVHFRKVFKEVTGLSPGRFLQRRRIEKSCVLLRTTQESIDAIAYSCGFADTPYFYRVFRKWMGTSPSIYRNARRT